MMKASLLTVFLLLGGCCGTVHASEGNEKDKDESAELKLLIQEIRDLGKRVEHLEKRILMSEKSINIVVGPPPPKTIRRIFTIPKKKKRDLGLYVFPGLDLPSSIGKSVERE